MQINLRKSIFTEEFDYNLLKFALREYKNPRVKINNLLKKNEIIRVKKGLYVFGREFAREPYSKEILANLIFGPSYISLEYALSYYGIIPERIETVTSITTKRKKFFNTPVGDFSYKFINSSIYSFGITIHKIDNYHSILIAEKEKALADFLYFSEKFSNELQMKKFLFENLRIDKEVLLKFNRKKIKKLAKMYGQNIKILYNLIK